ncbi:MAG TPA: DUF2007 domain-containing protein [Candidatus Binataceae bacterium]|nr:DUF2007 domain-containing protein [Candidatus Binataceae bacterium]
MADQQQPNPDELEEVFTAIDPTQALMARDYLVAEGIDVFVTDEESSRMLGTTAAVPSRLMVHADDIEEARRILTDLGFIEKEEQ